MSLRKFLPENSNYFSFMVYFAGIFLGLPFSSYTIVIFLLIQLYLLIKEGVKPIRNINKAFYIPIIFYAIHIISVFYSSNKAEGYFDLQVKLSFLILPVFFALKKDEHQVSMDKISGIFIAITGFATLAYFLKAFLIYFSTGVFPMYMHFANPLHPSYFALYLVVNLMFIFYQIIQSKSFNWVSSVSGLISIIALLYAESKAGLITVVVLFSLFLFILFFKKSKVLAYSVFVFFVLGISSLFVFNPRFKSIVVAGLNIEKVFEHPEKVIESTGLRLLAWDATMDLIKQNPIFGVGGGDIRDELVKVYRKKNYYKPMVKRMNAHNQFLETIVGQGYMGLIVLLLLFGVLLFSPRFPFLAQAFLLVMILNLLFESMFNKQAGVVFFMMIYCLLLAAKKEKVPDWKNSTINQQGIS